MLKETQKVRVWFTLAVFPLTLLFHTGAGIGADTVRLAFSSSSATDAGFFTVIEEKLFERRGIDLTHVYIASSSVVMPAVLLVQSSDEEQARERLPHACPWSRIHPAGLLIN